MKEAKSKLIGLKTPQGKLRLHYEEEDCLSLEPRWRQRLDHYGNDGDGWASDAWDYEYAEPILEAVEKVIDTDKYGVDVGEKGYVNVYRKLTTEQC